MGSELYGEKPLEELVDIYDSLRKPVKSSDRKSGPYPYYGASGITDYVDSFIFEGEYLLLSEDGDNLRSRNTPIAFLANGKFWVNNHAHILQGNQANDTKYLCYALQIADITSYLSGSTRPKLNQKDMREIPVYTPPLAEQKAIAHVLGSLDDKIELNRQMNETLEGMAQALFKSWFVDFDPVLDNALAAGNPNPDELEERAETRRQALENGTANREISKLFPATFEDFLQVFIPAGWQVIRIKDLVTTTDFVSNGSFSSLRSNINIFDEPNYALYVRTTDHKKEYGGNLRYVDEESYKFLRNSPLLGKEVIISNVGDTGTVFRPPVWLGMPMTLASNAIMIKESKWNEFLYLYLTSYQGQHAIASIVGGSAQPKFNKTDFRSLQILIPDVPLIFKLNEFIDSIRKRQNINLEENVSLMNLRDTLLPKLISGELRIPDAEKLAEEALA